jgi:hypothetical protein
MITDTGNTVCEDQAVTTTTVSDDSWDTGPYASGNDGRNLGICKPIYAYILCTTTFTGAGSALQVDVISSAVTGLTSATTHVTLGTFDVDAVTAVAGTLFVASLPFQDSTGAAAYLRHLGFAFTETPSIAAGTVTGGFVRSLADLGQVASGLNFV